MLHHPYRRFLLSASLSTAAPHLDLAFWYDLTQYRRYEPVITAAALGSVHHHLWYLTPELVVLAFFDDNLPEDENLQMATTFRQTLRPLAPGKPGQPDVNPVAATLGAVKPPLAAFITERSWLHFK